jgi:plastocyanin
MKKNVTVLLALLAISAVPAFAGEIKGKVTCKGVRNSADAVVYVDAIPGKTFPAPAAHAKMDQKNMLFTPRVLPVLVGTTVDFLNSDAVLHNIFSPDACAEKMNLGTWPQGKTKSYTFKKQCVSGLLCNVHPEMEGFVVAVPTPYYAVTAADGSYAIQNVPDGTYDVKVWHPKLKAGGAKVTVKGTTEAGFQIAK